MLLLFRDSCFLIAAWRQFLETKAPEETIFYVGNKMIPARAVLEVLEGRSGEPAVVVAITEFLTTVMSEAVHTVRGRFAAGLDNGGGQK